MGLSGKSGRLLASVIGGVSQIIKNCCCSGGGGTTFPVVCGTHSTCADWCRPQYQAFYQGENCECPCSERRDFPNEYTYVWTGVELDIGTVRSFPGGGGYWKITSDWDKPFQWGSYCDAYGDLTAGWYPDGLPPKYQVQQYDSSMTPTFLVNAEAGVPMFDVAPGDCSNTDFDGTDPTKLYVRGYATGSDGSNATPLAGCGGPISVIGLDAYNLPKLLTSRCDGGGVHPSTIPDAIGQFAATSGGTITVTPQCHNCDGSWITGEGSPNEKCAHNMVATMTYWNGEYDGSGDPIYLSEIYYLTGSSAQGWTSDSSTYGGSAKVMPVFSDLTGGSVECCKMGKPTSDCRCGNNGRGTGCFGCWELTISGVGGGEIQIKAFCNGDCPNGGWTLVSFVHGGTITPGHPYYTDFNAGFSGSDCP